MQAAQRSRAVLPRRVSVGVLLSLALASGCETRSPMRIRPGPVVQEHTYGPSSAALAKVAVVPFFPAGQSVGPAPGGALVPSETTPTESAALLGGFVSEALRARGLRVVPPNDVELAFIGSGSPVPRQDPQAAAVLAGKSFGASSVLLGRVLRYREREGSGAGSTRPASVAFEVSLHQVPSGRRLWTGRFDETQKSLTEAVLRARQYPGGGTRWLTAAEFARWGAQEVVKSLLSGI